MKLFAVVGSPRERGNTDLLVDALLEGARESGATVEKVYLTGLDIKPCDGCRVCRTGVECVLEDDMTPLYDKLREADAWVVGTPLYWYGPSGQTKIFIDRWYAFLGGNYGPTQGKRAALVSPFGGDDPAKSRHLVGMLDETFHHLKMEFVGQVMVTAREKGVVGNNAAALEQARDLGRRLAAGQ